MPLAAGNALATTRVSVSGTVVTITVPIDVFGDTRIRDLGTGVVCTAGPYWEKGAEQIWNNDIAKLPYRDCLTFKLDIEIKEFAAGTRDGAHGVDF